MSRRALVAGMLAVIASGCTLGVEETTALRSVTWDKPGWNTFQVRASDMSAGLQVTGTSESSVKASATVAALVTSGSKEEAFAGASLGFAQDSGVLRLTLATAGDLAELIYFQGLAVHAPATVNLDLEADDTAVTVKDMAGEVKVNAGSGGIDVTTGGSVDLRASSGSIKASAGFKATVRGSAGAVVVVAGSILDIETGSGDVQADTPTGGVVRTDGGKIDLKLTSPNFGATTAEGTDNDVIVRIPKGAQYTLDAFSDQGAISIAVGGLVLDQPYNGPVNGGGPLVTVRTTTGNLFVSAE